MSCGFDKGLLAAHHDGETAPEERAEVERHLAGCPECARDLASMKDLSAALKPLSTASAPMSIAEGVLSEIAPARSASFPWVRWGLSAAATLLVAVGTFFILNRDRSAPDRNEVALERTLAPSVPKKPQALDDAGVRSELHRESAE